MAAKRTQPSNRGMYSISAVSRLTGLSSHTLRAWESRYRLISPSRSQSGKRFYSPEQVQRLRQIATLVRSGNPIGRIARQIRSGVPIEKLCPADEASVTLDRRLVEGFLAVLSRGELREIESTFGELQSHYSPMVVATELLCPTLVLLGEQWYLKRMSTTEVKFATAFIHRKLQHMMDETRGSVAPAARSAMCCTLEGDLHEGGILIFSLVLQLHGWRVIYLGTDVPLAELPAAVGKWRPDVLCVSFPLARGIRKKFDALKRIKGVPIVVGGRSIVDYQCLARQAGTLPLVGNARFAMDEFEKHFKPLPR